VLLVVVAHDCLLAELGLCDDLRVPGSATISPAQQNVREALVLDGFYQARFETSEGNNCGVITLTEGNKLCGGNNELMYVGTYTRQGTNFFAEVEVKKLFGIKTSGGVFREGLKINMRGSGGFQNILCVCESPDLPGVEMKAVLERVPF
jgi:hypothetical protein